MNKRVFFYFLCLGFAALQSCDDKTLMKENYNIKDGKWFVKDAPVFSFEVLDTLSSYNVFYNVRNNSSYPYYNLYLTHYLYDAKNKVIHQKLDELILSDATTGKPTGDGLGDINDHKVLAFKDFKFPHKGQYKIQVRQYMRQNPLPDVVSVGITIEKTLAK